MHRRVAEPSLLRCAVLGTMLTALAACGSDEIEVPETVRGETTCMWVADTMIHFDDGSSSLLSHPDTHLTGAACTCMTHEQWEAGGWKDELSTQAFEVCEGLAALYEGVVWSECQKNYESGRWLTYTFWHADDLEPPAMYDPGCIGE